MRFAVCVFSPPARGKAVRPSILIAAGRFFHLVGFRLQVICDFQQFAARPFVM
jgi:hypothetical protein